MKYRIGIRIRLDNRRWIEFGGPAVEGFFASTKEEIAEVMTDIEIAFNERHPNKRMYVSLEEIRS